MTSFRVAGKLIEEVQGCLPINCTDLTLRIAAQKLGPAFTYDLFVHPKSLVSMRGMIRRMAADLVDNPLAPYVNLLADPNLPRADSWYLRLGFPVTGERYVGSEGF